MTDVVRRVVGRRGLDVQAVVDARVERALVSTRQALSQLGQADEEQGQERAAVPLVVAQDVQVIEHVLVEQVRLVEQEDGVALLGGELLDVARDLVEDGGGGLRVEAEGEADVPVEVASAERGVVAVGQAEAGLGEAASQGPQHARFADAGLAGEEHRLARGERLDELVDDRGLRRRQPEVRGPRRQSPW